VTNPQIKNRPERMYKFLYQVRDHENLKKYRAAGKIVKLKLVPIGMTPNRV